MSHRTRAIGILIPLLLACSLSGCVSRRLTIRSDPPGALVELDGRRLGYTPVSVDFTYYATNEITLSVSVSNSAAASTTGAYRSWSAGLQWRQAL